MPTEITALAFSLVMAVKAINMVRRGASVVRTFRHLYARFRNPHLPVTSRLAGTGV